MRCHEYQTKRLEFLNSIYYLDPKVRTFSNDKLLNLLLYGSKLYSFKRNIEIIKLTIKFLKSSKQVKRHFIWPVSRLPPPSTSAKKLYYSFLKFFILFKFFYEVLIVSVCFKQDVEFMLPCIYIFVSFYSGMYVYFS